MAYKWSAHDLQLGEGALPLAISSAYHFWTDLQILLSSCYSAAQNPPVAFTVYRWEFLLLHLAFSAYPESSLGPLLAPCPLPGSTSSAVLHTHLPSVQVRHYHSTPHAQETTPQKFPQLKFHFFSDFSLSFIPIILRVSYLSGHYPYAVSSQLTSCGLLPNSSPVQGCLLLGTEVLPHRSSFLFTVPR